MKEKNINRIVKIMIKLFLTIIIININYICFAEEKYTRHILLELTNGSGPYQFGTWECDISEEGKCVPGLVHADKQGNIYFYDDINYRISKYDSNGKFIFDIKGNYIGIGLDKIDNLYTFGPGTSKIFNLTVLNKNGQIIKEYPLSPYTLSYEGFVSWNGSVAIRIDEHSEGGDRGRHYGYKFDSRGKDVIKIEKSKEDIKKEHINFYEDADGNIWETEIVERIKGKGMKYRYVKYEKNIDSNGYERKGKKLKMKKDIITGGVIIGFDGRSNVYIERSDVKNKKEWIEKYNSEGELLAKVPILYPDNFVPSYNPTVDFHGNIYQLERSSTKIKVICYERQKGK